MAYMGYEIPVEMPSMGVYNTDLMKMYIAGVKEQYDQAREEMKDFMKLYQDFYSDVPGATELYNDLTIKGASDLINKMYAQGIDPYKSPEARAIISQYIAGAPVGKLNEMKRSAENAAMYKKALAQAINDPNFDPEYNRAMIGGDLETWNPNKPWTATAPYIAPSAEKLFSPYMEKFKQSEILPKEEQDRPGYIKVGTTKENQQGALRMALENYEKTPYGQYKRQQANQLASQATNPDGTPLTDEQRKALSDKIFAQPAEDYARQFFQPKYEDDWKYKADYENRQAINRYWATTGANPTPNNGGSKATRITQPGEEGYLPLFDSVQKAMTDIYLKKPVNKGAFLSGDDIANTYKQVQDHLIKQALAKGVSAQDALKEITRTDDSGRYAEWNDRQAQGGSGNRVLYEIGDENNIYSAAELLYKAGYSSGAGSQGKQVRSWVKKKHSGYKKDGIDVEGVNVTKRDLGGVIPLQVGKEVRVYKPIEIAGSVMYEDTGYRLDEQGRMLEDKSIAAKQRDVRAGIKQYSLKQNEKVGELNM